MGPRHEGGLRAGAEPEASAAHSAAAGLPPELAFLPPGSVAPDLLHQAAASAARLGVPVERVVMAEGLLSAEVYYRHLASHLGLPLAERPLRPAPEATLEAVLRLGLMPLAPNAHGWTGLAAPTGPVLRRLLDAHGRGEALVGLALTTPDRLEALIRQERHAGIAHAASYGLRDWNRTLSARSGLTPQQTLWLATVATALGLAALLAPHACAEALALLFSAAFLLAVGVRLVATAASPAASGPRRRAGGPEASLPVYTVVVPLFREAREVVRLVAALDRIDYPAAKLDILLMVEANDRTTLKALERLHLPSRYRTIMAPPGRPQTKPRALNVALQFARGEFLVVFDAEDEPEPDQLRAALTGFAAAPDIACLQARLAIDNIGDSWLTRLFAIEYAALFDVVNPGLAALRCPVPLGGTSNHFRMAVLRQVNGWDAWNVTEDIDLGIRLARFGHRVATVDSTTFEEAPRTLKAWLAQRRRWQKGWMVTFATHSRAPLRTWRELGFWPGLAMWGVVFGTVVSCLLGPFCVVMAGLRLWSGDLLNPRTPGDAAWSLFGCVLLAAGAASALWPALAGLARRRRLDLAVWLPTLPIYLLLLSLAAWLAAFEVVGRPYVWAKTEHGRAKRRFGVAARR